MKERLAPYIGPVLGVASGAGYGLAARWSAGRPGSPWLVVMSIGFVFLMPFGIGFLTAFWARTRSWPYRIFMPWVSATLMILASVSFGWEGWICVVMAFPVFFISSSLGGVAEGLLRRYLDPPPYAALVVALVLPFIVGGLENGFEAPRQVRQVENRIRIAAPADVVWAHIIRVEAIREDEHHFSFFHTIGFPRPVEATLSHEGVGGVRHATFERDVLFVETITDWEPLQRLSFEIDAEAGHVPPSALDEHVTVGGAYFDTLTGTYEIVEVEPGIVELRLSSTHRLSTRFNFYSGLWTDAVMRSIQGYILEILKDRCERDATSYALTGRREAPRP